MNTRDQEPLSPEERDLAQRLSRLGGHAAPSASLDARILAAARTAVGEPPAAAHPQRRRRPRWPFGMGIAASLAVALGIAWQLRPQPDQVMVPVSAEASLPQRAVILEAPAPADSAAPAVASESDAAPMEPERATTLYKPAPAGNALPASPAPEPAPVATPAPAMDAPVVVDESALRRAASADEAERRQRNEVVFDAAMAPPPAPAPPPPPPPPASSAAPAAARTPDQPGFVASPPATATATAIGANTQLSRERKAAAQSAAAAADARPTLDRIEVTGSRATRADAYGVTGGQGLDDQPLDDRPPASADSPEVRDAWLKRIRDLRAAGQLDDARASLHEFTRRHPDTKVPDDLRPLLGE